MNHFEYVMVLISIIVGLGIAHILLGIGGIVDRLTGRGERLRLSIAHAAWLAHTFFWLVLFWWWQFRLEVIWGEEWTVGVYLFLVTYAVVLFLLAVILVPRDWDGVVDLDDFFVRRRAWFYSLWIVGVLLDVLDSWLKGGMDYIMVDLGPSALVHWLAAVTVSAIGIRARGVRYHATAGVVLLLLDFATSVVILPTLGF